MISNLVAQNTCNVLFVAMPPGSPLENMHCARLFQIVADPEANVFSQLEKDLYKEMRKAPLQLARPSAALQRGLPRAPRDLPDDDFYCSVSRHKQGLTDHLWC